MLGLLVLRLLGLGDVVERERSDLGDPSPNLTSICASICSLPVRRRLLNLCQIGNVLSLNVVSVDPPEKLNPSELIDFRFLQSTKSLSV